MALVTKWLLD